MSELPHRQPNFVLGNEVAEQAKDMEFLHKRRGELVIERDAARAEVQRLREALGLAQQAMHWHRWHDPKSEMFKDRASLEARASDAVDAALRDPAGGEG